MTLIESIRQKFHPSHIKTSDKMLAILGWLVQESWTNPSICGICRTSDNFVLAMQSGDCGCNDFIGAWSDFERNVLGCSEAAGLTTEEIEWISRRLAGIRSTC